MSEAAPLSILHVVANRWWTGSADPTLRLVLGLRARGHRVLLGLIPGDRFEAKARAAGVEPVAGLRLRPGGGVLGIARDLRALRSVVAREGVQVVHAHHSHDHWLAVLARARGAEGQRVPVVRTVHTPRAVRSGALGRRLLQGTPAVFAVSRGVETRCLEAGVPRARLHWIPGAADLARFAPGDADGRAIRTEFGLGDAPLVVTVSRLAPNRGHELLLDAFRLALERVPAARLLVVGKGEMRDRLERAAVDLGLAGRAIFAGYRDGDLPDVLAAADCFALMGAGSDDSCRAALEAMASARPVVARRVGALPETVVHGETGLLAGDDRPESVAAALAQVLGDRGLARAMGRAGRARAEREFSADRVVAAVEAVYRTLG